MELKNFLFSGAFRKPQQSAQLSAFYAGELARWADIYNGGGDWRWTRRGGLSGGTRRVAALNAAKALCAELSRLCFAEGTQIVSPDGETERFLLKTLADNNFWERFPDFLEKVFALGGGAVRVYWDGGVKLDFVTAECFVPTVWDGRGISGGAFGSKIVRGAKSYVLAQTQELTDDGCVIENRLLNENGSPAKLADVFPDMAERSVIEGLTKPLFVYFRAGSGSGESGCGALGTSVFASAEDTLRELDTVFDSLCREFVLGKKRIIVPYYAVRGEYDEKGDIKRYFDANDEVFQAMSTTDAEELKITDNTAQLRVTEHLEALNALLDMLCMQAGLSEGALSYKAGSVRTATEVISRGSRSYRMQRFYRGLIAAGLARVAENVCILGKMGGLLSESASEKAELAFADGVCEDEGTRTDRAVKLYGAGLISRARALSQIYGVSMEEALAMERTDNNGNGA